MMLTENVPMSEQTNEVLDISDRAKVVSDWMATHSPHSLPQLCETVKSLPKTLSVQFFAVNVKDASTLGEGYHQYNYQDFCTNQATFSLLDDDDVQVSHFNNDYDDYPSYFGERSPRNRPVSVDHSVILVAAVDEQGHTVTVRAKNFGFFIYVQCPDRWSNFHFANLAKHLEDKQCLPPGSVHWQQQWRSHFCGWQPDPRDASKTRQWNYCVLAFPNVKNMKSAATTINRGSINVPGVGSARLYAHESRIDAIHKFYDLIDASPSSWVTISNYTLPDKYHSHSQIEIECDWRDIKPMPDKNMIPYYRKAYWDIECYSHDGSFPDPTNPKDFIICINTYVKIHGTDLKFEVCHHLGSVDKPDNVIVYTYDSEMALLEGWRDFIVLDIQPQITGGFNIDTFDQNYIYEKALQNSAYGQNSRFFYMSTLIDEKTTLYENNLSSNAMGDNALKVIQIPDRLSLDIFFIIKKEHKLDGYGLTAVSQHFLGDQKIDLPYWKIWSNYDEGQVSRRETVEYAAKDCELPCRLEEHLQLLPNMIEMSKVTRTGLNQLLTRGQQIKTMNQLVYYSHRFGYVINRHNIIGKTKPVVGATDDGYEGATVLNPKCGYYDVPIPTLDFVSLYPSIMQAHNLCYSTLVENEQYMNLPGASYEHIQPIPTKTNTFVQHVKGVVPRILSVLKKERSKVKGEQKQFTRGSLQWNILEGKQLAIKITMNSIYGFFGAVRKGILPCVAISESVTCIGREMIEHTKHLVETKLQEYGQHLPEIVAKITNVVCIYGDTDSVMIKFEGIPGGSQGIALAFQIATAAAEYVTATFPEDIVLEMEKVYYPYVLYLKKKYAGMMYLEPNPKDGPIMDIKGLPAKRRDSWLGLRKTYKECLDAMLVKMDLDLAKTLLLQLLDQVVNDEFVLKDYEVSKGLKKTYDPNKAPPPHVHVRNKIRARAPGSEPKTGNRVPFVIIEMKPSEAQDGKFPKVWERAEDPAYVQDIWDKRKECIDRGEPYDHLPNIKIDRMYYIESLEKPFSTMLEPCFENPEQLFEEAKGRLYRQKSGIGNICQFLCSNSDRNATGADVGQKRRRLNPSTETPEQFNLSNPDVQQQVGRLDFSYNKTNRISRKIRRRENGNGFTPKSVLAKETKEKKLKSLGDITKFIQVKQV